MTKPPRWFGIPKATGEIDPERRRRMQEAEALAFRWRKPYFQEDIDERREERKRHNKELEEFLEKLKEKKP